MSDAFQIVAITDRLDEKGQRQVEIYAATTVTAEDALALAKKRLPVGWDVAITPNFRYASNVVGGLEPDELHQMH